MAKSNLEIIISAKDQASKELKKVDDGLEEVNEEAKKSSKGIVSFGTDMLKMGGVAAGVAAGAVIAGKAIFELGKAGAEVEQTGESFDFLIDKLELAPDLLEQLSEAALGTIDDMTLMSSVSTLLAGTSQELGTELGLATPKLLEIAKAANKLNPSLGSTSKLFGDIALGVKRASPMILDNLGLTISLGQANSDFAKSLGKSVDALTEEEKKLALLNATMKAGDKLIAQVGGNLESATDDFARMEVAIKNLKDEMSKTASGPIADLIDGVLELVEWMGRYEEGLVAIKEAYDDGIITEESAADLRAQYMSDLINIDDLLWTLGLSQEHYDRAVDRTSISMGHLVDNIIPVAPAVDEAGDAMDNASGPTEEFAKRMEGLRDKTAEVLANLREVTQLKIDEYFDVDMRIGAEAAQLFDITLFKEAGGEALEILVGQIQAGLVDNKITSAQAREFFKNVAVEAAAIEVEMGKIDVSKAAEKIAKDFNIPLKDTRDLLDKALIGIDLINGADVSAITEEFDALQERKEELLEAGEFDIEADPGEEAQNTLDTLEDTLYDLTDTPWQIYIETIVGGDDIPGGGGGGGGGSTGSKPKPKRRAVGGPAIESMPYLVGERGPELFVPDVGGQIVPNNQITNNESQIVKNEPQIVNNWYVSINNDADVEVLALRLAEVYRTRME